MVPRHRTALCMRDPDKARSTQLLRALRNLAIPKSENVVLGIRESPSVSQQSGNEQLSQSPQRLPYLPYLHSASAALGQPSPNEGTLSGGYDIKGRVEQRKSCVLL